MDKREKLTVAALGPASLLLAVPLAVCARLSTVEGRLYLAAATLVPFVLGVTALAVARGARATPGRGTVMAGTVIAIVLLVLLVPSTPESIQAREERRRKGCANNLSVLTCAMLVYASDHDGRLPLAASWTKDIEPYVKHRRDFRCPSLGGDLDSYAFNSALSGAELARLSDLGRTVLLFDGPPGTNVTGGHETVELRHLGGANLAFADGHVKWESDLSMWVWEPELAPPGD